MLTLEQARLGAKRSVEARKRYAADRKELARVKDALLKQAVELKAKQDIPSPEIQSARVREVVEMLVEQINETCEALRSPRLEPRDRAQLLGALDRLIERERVLRGIPAPGPTKQVAQRRQVAQAGGFRVPATAPSEPPASNSADSTTNAT